MPGEVFFVGFRGIFIPRPPLPALGRAVAPSRGNGGRAEGTAGPRPPAPAPLRNDGKKAFKDNAEGPAPAVCGMCFTCTKRKWGKCEFYGGKSPPSGNCLGSLAAAAGTENPLSLKKFSLKVKPVSKSSSSKLVQATKLYLPSYEILGCSEVISMLDPHLATPSKNLPQNLHQTFYKTFHKLSTKSSTKLQNLLRNLPQNPLHNLPQNPLRNLPQNVPQTFYKVSHKTFHKSPHKIFHKL